MGKLIDRTGERKLMNCGLYAEIIEYKSYENIAVKFENGNIRTNINYGAFKKGQVKNKEYDINKKIGDININKQGLTMRVIDYRSYSDIDVEFVEDGYVKRNVSYGNFIKGNISRPLYPSVYGVGIVDIKATDSYGNILPSYKCWSHMLERCYDIKYKKKETSYKECKCSDEWKYFSNFKKWYDGNIYELNNERIALDKDILVKNNKLYSKETCLLVPQSINNLFIKLEKKRTDLPMGVTYYPKYDKYMARTVVNDKRVILGYFETPIEAFYEYKIYKELNIKIMADKYKDKIPQKLYNAMYDYEVEITD